MNIKPMTLSPQADGAFAGELRVRDVCDTKFHAGLVNGSLIAMALWVGLFFAIHG